MICVQVPTVQQFKVNSSNLHGLEKLVRTVAWQSPPVASSRGEKEFIQTTTATGSCSKAVRGVASSVEQENEGVGDKAESLSPFFYHPHFLTTLLKSLILTQSVSHLYFYH